MGNQHDKHYPQNQPQTVVLPDGSRRSKHLHDTDPSYRDNLPDVPTVYEAFLQGARRSNDGLFLGRREHRQPDAPYEWLSYDAISVDATAFGAGLIAECRLRPSNTTNVGIFSQNRVEWGVVDQACVRYSMVSVPLYSTLGDEAVSHIVEQAELSVIVVDTADKVAQLTAVGKDLSRIQYLILIDGQVDEDTNARAKQLGWRVLSYNSVLESGRTSPRELRPPSPDDVYTISYTSGTTGVPKGVVITHRSMVNTACCGIQPLVLAGKKMDSSQVTLSYLPLAHIYERMCTVILMLVGGRMAFFNGDILRLFDDVREVKPTIFSSVPRVLQKVYDKIYAAAGQSGPKRALLDWAVESKMKDLKLGILRDDTVWDSLVFHKVRELFGGRLEHLNVGAAPTSPAILNFFRVALNVTIYHGYGQTETGGVASVSAPYDFRPDHVGPPVAGVAIKLIDVPDLGYFASDGFGEICVRGPTVFREYYRMREKTRETKDDEGWVHTGDVGTWTNQGNLKIVDRCKQIFKLSQGEYIAPEKVEGVYLRCPHVSQVYIDGCSDKDYIVAVVVPDFDVLKATRKLASVHEEELCRDPDVAQLILDEMASVGRENGLKGFEIVRRVRLHATPFSAENGLLTVTMKSKRNVLQKHFAGDVAAMYEE